MRNALKNFLCVLPYTRIINYDKRQARTGLKLALVDVFYVCFVFNNNKKQVTSNSTIITQNTTRQQRSYVGFVCCYLKGNHVELGKMYVAKVESYLILKLIGQGAQYNGPIGLND